MKDESKIKDYWNANEARPDNEQMKNKANMHSITKKGGQPTSKNPYTKLKHCLRNRPRNYGRINCT